MATKRWEEIEKSLDSAPDAEVRKAEARERVSAWADAYYARLADLRKARGATQVVLGERAGLSQSGVARIERQVDLYVSTLRRYVEALGGSLEIRAVFPDQNVEIRFDDFATIDHDNPDIGRPDSAPEMPSATPTGLEQAL